MKILNETGYEHVDQAIVLFLDKAPKIIKAIKDLPAGSRDFSYTNLNNFQVAMYLDHALQSEVTLKIKLFTPWNPFSSVIGFTNGDEEIFMNSRKICALSAEEIAENIGHEFCHFPGGFNHGFGKTANNIRIDTAKKLMSVPYAFGFLISGERKFPLDKYRPHVVD